MALPTLLRKLHYWGSIVIAVPIAVVIGTGLLLQLKKEIAWIQPTEVKTAARDFAITPDQILNAAKAQPALAVRSWSDIARIDIRPDRGLVKVSAQNHWELQLHSATGETLQVAYRRSDLIESIHDGSWFHDSAKLWIFFPSGIVLFGLWLTGMYLFALPYWVRSRRRSPAQAGPRPGSAGA
jgi:uncharacterized iron-regulated membrane protein